MSRPLTLALVSFEYPPGPNSGGVGSYTKTVADGMRDRGHTVHVVTRGEGRDSVLDEDGVRVHRVTPGRPPLPTTFGVRATAKLATIGLVAELRYRRNLVRRIERLVREEGIELIEVADVLAEPGGYRPDRAPGVPFVVRMHAPFAHSETIDTYVPEPIRRGVGLLERRMLLRADLLTAPSRYSAEEFREAMRLGDRPIVTYPNPPTFDLAPADDTREEPATVLFVGRLQRMKGPQLLARALPRVAAAVPEVRFVLIGADNYGVGDHDSMTDYLRSLVPDGLRDRLEFTGHVDHAALPAYYRRATVCVFPSLFESFGYGCLEAMTYGKAIVAGARGGMRELLDDGRAGLLFDPPDVDALADRIVELLRDPRLRCALGEAARERFASRYHPDRVMDGVESFYRATVAEGRRVGAGA